MWLSEFEVYARMPTTKKTHLDRTDFNLIEAEYTVFCLSVYMRYINGEFFEYECLKVVTDMIYRFF